MINELKPGTSTLRFENSRRHKIRNLRAKVRSLLPEQVCAREMKQRHKNNISQSGQHTGKLKRYQSSDFDKNMNKEFDKLTKQEIEEINSNKYYFLGSEEGILFYQRYLNHNHPEFIQKQFVSPVVSSENVAPFNFVPMTFLDSRQKQGSKSFVTIKEIPEKRGSTASTNHRKRSNAVNPLNSGRRSPLTKMQKIERCKYNKNEHDEQIRIKREIGYAHLQRQQKQASASRLIQVQGKVEQARVWNTSSTFAKYESQSSKNVVQKYEIALLASKLRKVCLKKSYNNSVMQGEQL